MKIPYAFIYAMIMPVLLASCAQRFYIVRHAEKASADAMMSSDVPLSNDGAERAVALRDLLRDKKIGHIYSTNTLRTRSTAQPLADLLAKPVEIYGPRPDSSFIVQLRAIKGNALVVGHSNTIDDVVNLLCGRKEVAGDLPETQYDNLFIVTRKGKHLRFRQLKFGKPSR